jgi:hypothetical protein
MKYFHFALSGMVVLLYLFSSCSNGETESGKQEVIEEITQDDGTEAYEETPVTKNDEEVPADGIEPDTSSPDDEDGDPPELFLNVPVLQINEIYTEYKSQIAEFIEFKMLSAGNLGGLRVFIASNVNKPVFEFKPVGVKKGDYVVLHLRTLGTECKDEYGEDLNESGGTDSSSTARDFWVHGGVRPLLRNDAIYIMDQDEHVVLDAVIILENTGTTVTEWPKLSLFIDFLLIEDAWKFADRTNPSPTDAVNISGIDTNYIRSVSRDETVEDTDTAADWYVTANYGATPGKKNNPNRFVVEN